jgi:phage repressor protein C with HTH and peptisase S24 domain
MAIGKNIKACREYLGWTLDKLSRASGVDTGTISALENRDSVRSQYAKAIAEALGLTLDQLTDGALPNQQNDLGLPIQTPPRPIKAINNIDEAEHDIIEIPRYTLRASAGKGEPVWDIDEKGQPNYMRRAWAIHRNLDPNNLFSIVAVGDSMEPTLHDGDSLTVNRQNNIEDNKLMVICYRSECYVKRILRQFDGSLIIRSDNTKNYRDIIITQDQIDELLVVGRVVSVAHNL